MQRCVETGRHDNPIRHITTGKPWKRLPDLDAMPMRSTIAAGRARRCCTEATSWRLRATSDNSQARRQELKALRGGRSLGSATARRATSATPHGTSKRHHASSKTRRRGNTHDTNKKEHLVRPRLHPPIRSSWHETRTLNCEVSGEIAMPLQCIRDAQASPIPMLEMRLHEMEQDEKGRSRPTCTSWRVAARRCSSNGWRVVMGVGPQPCQSADLPTLLNS